MTVNLYLGIDPGVNGGLARLGGGGILSGGGFDFKSMPGNDAKIYEWIRGHSQEVLMDRYQAVCVIERIVPAFPGSSKGSMAKLYGSYRALCMALTACSMPSIPVMAQVWQRKLGIPVRTSGEKKSVWKGRLKKECERLFPNLKVTLATCDALLIAHYCKLYHEGRLS